MATPRRIALPILLAIASLAGCSAPPPSVRAGAAHGSPSADASSPPTAPSAAPSTESQPGAPTSTTTGSSPDSSPGSVTPGPLVFAPCDDLADAECATFDVPFDYAAPEKGMTALHVIRRPADDQNRRIGTVLVNPGGPGAGTSYLFESPGQFFSSTVRKRFDIVSIDPRGTGRSEPAVDCIGDDGYDRLFGLDPSPDDAAELTAIREAQQAFVDACVARVEPQLLAHLSTPNAARDMNQLRLALGEDKISYIGFSYGSELGATWATMFPQTVRAAVLDGAVDPTQTPTERSLSQLLGFESAFTGFLNSCRRHDCSFAKGADPTAAIEQLAVALDRTPLAGRTPVNEGVLSTAIAMAMYSEQLWPRLEDALGAAADGDGSGLLALYDQYLGRDAEGHFDNTLEAFLAISCADESDRGTVEGAEKERAGYVAAAPIMGKWWGYDFICPLWPVPAEPRVPVTGKGAGPIVVVGTTGDPATPLDSTEAMANALEGGTLVIVEANKHTGQLANDCVTDAVDAYLVELTVPTPELYCR